MPAYKVHFFGWTACACTSFQTSVNTAETRVCNENSLLCVLPLRAVLENCSTYSQPQKLPSKWRPDFTEMYCTY